MIARSGWLYRALYAAAEFLTLLGLLVGIPALIYVLYIASDGPVP